MDRIFFDSWGSIFRSLVITILAYLFMIVMLRVSGKRTLSKMNAFDFIITIALGSSLATVALNKNVALADGALVFFLLIFLQYLVTWLSVRVKKVEKIVTNQPTLLLYKGEFLNDVAKKERITIESIYAAARKKGISELKDIDLIVLETTGDITILSNIPSTKAETVQNVENLPK